MKKILTIAMAIVMMMAITIPAFAAEENSIVIANTGSTKEPIFVTEYNGYAYCIQRDVKAPSANGIEYVSSETNIDLSVLENVFINTYLAKTCSINPTVVQYAVWGILENEVENYRVLCQIRFGEESVALYDSLFNEVDGNYEVTFKVFEANGYQKMIIPTITELMSPTVEEPSTEEPIIEEPKTEEPVTKEPETEEPSIEEPIIEEPVIEEPVLVEPDIVEESETEESLIILNEEDVLQETVPNTGLETTSVVIFAVFAAIVCLAFFAYYAKRKAKFSKI